MPQHRIGSATRALTAAPIAALIAGLLFSLLSGTVGQAEAQSLRGVNLAGAAFHSDRIPGRYGPDFVFPKPDEIAYYTGRGMNVFRLSVLWERLQPTLGGPIDPAYLSRVQQFIHDADHAGARTIIDVHDYGRYRGTAIGTGDIMPEAFAQFWGKMAAIFKDDRNVMFGLMNEPQLASATDWAADQQQAIDAIRRAGARNTILVSGIKWDSAGHFPQDNGDALAALRDPQNNMLFEAHEYFDRFGSGTKPDCVPDDQVVGRLSPFTAWLQAHHARGFLGEFGVSRDPACLRDLDIVADYLAHNPRTWAGWSYWAGGPIWGEYMFTLEPTRDGADRPQMNVLAKYLHGSGH